MPVSSFNIISTNARSITPKIENFIDYSNELKANLAFLTETWLSDSDELFSDLEQLELATGYSMLCKNCPPNSRGNSTGGIALVFKKSHITFKEIVLPGNDFEILFAIGTMPRFTRKMIAICVYMPPGICYQMLGVFNGRNTGIKRKI